VECLPAVRRDVVVALLRREHFTTRRRLRHAGVRVTKLVRRRSPLLASVRVTIAPLIQPFVQLVMSAMSSHGTRICRFWKQVKFVNCASM
jgi:hypothetical protein